MSIACVLFFCSGCGKNYFIEVPKETIVISYGEKVPLDQFIVTSGKNGTIGEVENASKGTVEYDAETIEEQTATFIYKNAEAKFQLKIEPIQLKQPEIKYKNNKISWKEIENATNYEVVINGTTYKTKEPVYSLEHLAKPTDKFVITVQAISEDERYVSSDVSEVFRLDMQKLSAPSNIIYREGKISWKRVDGADEYEIWLNNGLSQTVLKNEIEHFIDGECNIKVVAKSSDVDMLNSDISEMTFRELQPVSDIVYNDGVISWNTLEENCQYLIIIGKEKYKSENAFLEYDLNLVEKETVAVQAIPIEGNEHFIASEVVSRRISSTSEMIGKVTTGAGTVVDKVTTGTGTVVDKVTSGVSGFLRERLEKPELVVTQGNSKDKYIVEFEAIENATKYQIQVISYLEEEKETNTYEVVELKYEFVVNSQAKKIEVEVVAIDESGTYKDSKTAVEKIEIQ